MASKDVRDTASLVSCYNEAANEEEKSVLMVWLSRYISHFDTLTGVLNRCHWEAFLELGNIDSRGDTDKEVSRLYPRLVTRERGRETSGCAGWSQCSKESGHRPRWQ